LRTAWRRGGKHKRDTKQNKRPNHDTPPEEEQDVQQGTAVDSASNTTWQASRSTEYTAWHLAMPERTHLQFVFNIAPRWHLFSFIPVIRIGACIVCKAMFLGDVTHPESGLRQRLAQGHKGTIGTRRRLIKLAETFLVRRRPRWQDVAWMSTEHVFIRRFATAVVSVVLLHGALSAAALSQPVSPRIKAKQQGSQISDPRVQQAAVLLSQGTEYVYQGNCRLAITSWTSSLRLVKMAHYQTGEATISTDLGNAYRRSGNVCKALGQLGTAITCFGQALKLCDTDDNETLGTIELEYGNVFLGLSDFDRAIQHYQNAHAMCQLNIGKSMDSLNQHQKAVACYQRAPSDSTGCLVCRMNSAGYSETCPVAPMDNHHLVHIATHYKLDPASASGSHLVTGDGEVKLRDLSKMGRLFEDVDLLTLSACSTAVAETGDGLGRNGLDATAFALRAHTILATLWDVSDESTAELMRAF
jgi:hypothetical protein